MSNAGWSGLSNRKVKKLAYVVSRVFDPVVLVPLMLVLAAGGAFVGGERFRYLSLLVFLDGVLPGFVLIYFLKKGKISGWDIKKREERMGLFVFVVLVHLLGVLGAWLLNKHPLVEYLATFWVLALVYTLATVKWKISVHAGVMSALATFLVLVYGAGFAWVYGLVLLTSWARVVGNYHRLSQVLAGAGVPIVVMPVCFWILGLI